MDPCFLFLRTMYAIDSPSEMEFFVLPVELLESIFSALSKEDVVSVAYCSKKCCEIASRKRVLSSVLLREYNLKRTPLDIPDLFYLIYTKCEIESFSIPVIPRSTLYCLLKHNLERISKNLGQKQFHSLCTRLPEVQAVFLYQKAFKINYPNRRRNVLEDKDNERREYYNSYAPISVLDRILKLYCNKDSYSSHMQKLTSSCSREGVHKILRRCLKLKTNKNLGEVLQLRQAVVTEELLNKSGKSMESFLLLKEKYTEEWDAPLIQKAVKYENVDLIIHLIKLDNTYTECAVKHALLRDWPELLGVLEENKIRIPRVTLNLTGQRHSIRYCSSK